MSVDTATRVFFECVVILLWIGMLNPLGSTQALAAVRIAWTTRYDTQGRREFATYTANMQRRVDERMYWHAMNALVAWIVVGCFTVCISMFVYTSLRVVSAQPPGWLVHGGVAVGVYTLVFPGFLALMQHGSLYLASYVDTEAVDLHIRQMTHTATPREYTVQMAPDVAVGTPVVPENLVVLAPTAPREHDEQVPGQETDQETARETTRETTQETSHQTSHETSHEMERTTYTWLYLTGQLDAIAVMSEVLYQSPASVVLRWAHETLEALKLAWASAALAVGLSPAAAREAMRVVRTDVAEREWREQDLSGLAEARVRGGLSRGGSPRRGSSRRGVVL